MLRLALRAILVCAVAGGCASPPSPAPVVAADVLPDPPIAERGLAVHLVWAGPADLDLLVTDPNGETFSVEHRGDVVVGDVGCDEAARDGDGVETARWEAPPTGGYRIGVEFAAACGDAVTVPYRVLVDVDGRRRAVDGTAVPRQLTPNAAQVVIP